MHSLNPTEPAPGVFQPLLDRLRGDAISIFGAPVLLRPTACQVRPFSHVLRFGICIGGATEPSSYAFAKIFKPKEGPDGLERMRRRVVHEFDTTRAVHDGLEGHPGLDVVRPLACYPDLLALVTEEVHGDTLMAFLRPRVSWYPGESAVSAAEAVLARVGQWVRAFQDTTAPGPPVTVASLRDYVDLRLRRLEAHGRSLVTADVRRAILEHIEALGQRIPVAELREVPVHADLAPGNVMVSGDRVVVLDFAMTGRGTRLHDLTRLSMQLDLLSTKPRFRHAVIARLQGALLAGYDQAASPNDPLFRLLSMLHRVNHLGTLTLKPGRFPGRLLDRLQRRRHERWITDELGGR